MPKRNEMAAMPRGRWPIGASLEIDVTGVVPVPKGNMRAFVPKGWSRAVITDGKGKDLRAFEKQLRDLAVEEIAKRGLPCASEQPFEIELAIYLPRPTKDFDKVGGVRSAARSEPWIKPDIDKLVRGVLDALTGVVYDDDSRICRLVVQKKFGGTGHDVGLWLRASVRASSVREQREWSCQQAQADAFKRFEGDAA